MAEKSADNLLREIAASKSNELARLVYALGIRFVGERTAQLLAEHFGSMGAIAEANEQALTEVGEVGPKVAASIVEFFEEPANREVVKRLRAAGINPQHARQEAVSSRLAGPDICLHRNAGAPFTRGSRRIGGQARREGGELGE